MMPEYFSTVRDNIPNGKNDPCSATRQLCGADAVREKRPKVDQLGKQVAFWFNEKTKTPGESKP